MVTLVKKASILALCFGGCGPEGANAVSYRATKRAMKRVVLQKNKWNYTGEVGHNAEKSMGEMVDGRMELKPNQFLVRWRRRNHHFARDSSKLRVGSRVMGTEASGRNGMRGVITGKRDSEGKWLVSWDVLIKWDQNIMDHFEARGASDETLAQLDGTPLQKDAVYMFFRADHDSAENNPLTRAEILAEAARVYAMPVDDVAEERVAEVAYPREEQLLVAESLEKDGRTDFTDFKQRVLEVGEWANNGGLRNHFVFLKNKWVSNAAQPLLAARTKNCFLRGALTSHENLDRSTNRLLEAVQEIVGNFLTADEHFPAEEAELVELLKYVFLRHNKFRTAAIFEDKVLLLLRLVLGFRNRSDVDVTLSSADGWRRPDDFRRAQHKAYHVSGQVSELAYRLVEKVLSDLDNEGEIEDADREKMETMLTFLARFLWQVRRA